jgi:hypothetical protein
MPWQEGLPHEEARAVILGVGHHDKAAILAFGVFHIVNDLHGGTVVQIQLVENRLPSEEPRKKFFLGGGGGKGALLKAAGEAHSPLLSLSSPN